VRRPLWLVFALSLGGCGGGSISSSSPPPPSGGAFQTSWHAAVTSQTNSGFTSFDVFIEQNGTALQSQEVLLNYMCGQRGMMVGSATANTWSKRCEGFWQTPSCRRPLARVSPRSRSRLSTREEGGRHFRVAHELIKRGAKSHSLPLTGHPP
jgi:hypothetical protein